MTVYRDRFGRVVTDSAWIGETTAHPVKTVPSWILSNSMLLFCGISLISIFPPVYIILLCPVVFFAVPHHPYGTALYL